MNGRVITDPTDPRQLQLDDIVSCLDRAGKVNRDARPIDCRLERVGANNSTAYRVRLVYADGVRGYPESLFLKLCSGGTFGRSEVDYYTKDYVGLREAPIPSCYDAHFENSSYHLLLEDVSNTHRNNWDIEPTLAYGKAAARALARLHSYRWNEERLRNAGYDVVDKAQLDMYVKHVRTGFQPLLEAVQDDTGSGQVGIASDVFERHPDAMGRRLSSGGPFTLVHGDVNPGNILSRIDDPAKDVLLIDRQPFEWSLRSWIGPSDLSYMMVLWWDSGRRRALELDVLREYYDSLVEFGVLDYPWELTLADYRLSALQCFYVAASWCVNPEERSNMRWLWSVQLERACTFYRDWRCRETL